MRNIKVIFTQPRKFKIGAWLIQKWINKPYSHVAFNWVDDQGRDIIWQAAHGCVHIVLRDHFELDNNIIIEKSIDFTEQEYQHLRSFCYFYAGSLYAYIELIHIVIYDILRNFNIKFFEPDNGGFICSELVSLGLANTKGYILPKFSWLMRPDDVENLLK